MQDKTENRAKLINNSLATLSERGIHILYLVTEDRDILENTMQDLPNLYSYLPHGLKGYDSVKPENLFKRLTMDGILVDAAAAFGLIDSYGFDFPEQNEGNKAAKLYILRDFQMLEERAQTRFLHAFLEFVHRKATRTLPILFIISPLQKIPLGFEYDMEVLDVPEVNKAEIAAYLRRIGDYPDEAWIDEAADDYRGLQLADILKIQNRIFAQFGKVPDPGKRTEITQCRRKLVSDRKIEFSNRDSTITIIPSEDAVVGMKSFSDWAKDNIQFFINAKDAAKKGIEPPKGILACGLPGTGKTQMAKKIAHDMTAEAGNTIPLVQFRMDNILGGLVGDSEANFKRCRKRIEALAPCVVLIDEIEKTFDTKSSNSNNDVKMNLLSALLDWLQENKKEIFFYATCNNSALLPPELLRDGRFTMRYYSFMPTRSELEQIMAFHIRRTDNKSHAAGGLFKDKSPYLYIARSFFDRLGQQVKKKKEDCFYTGANIENLVQLTNIRMAISMERMPYDTEKYISAMLAAANSTRCQPYGMTNMEDIVDFWLTAYKNRYSNAGDEDKDLFSFRDYDSKECSFKNINVENGYDQYMRERISGAIEEKARRLKNMENR